MLHEIGFSQEAVLFKWLGVLLGANVVDANEVLTSDLFQGRLQQIQPHLRRAERYFRVNAAHQNIGIIWLRLAASS